MSLLDHHRDRLDEWASSEMTKQRTMNELYFQHNGAARKVTRKQRVAAPRAAVADSDRDLFFVSETDNQVSRVHRKQRVPQPESQECHPDDLFFISEHNNAISMTGKKRRVAKPASHNEAAVEDGFVFIDRNGGGFARSERKRYIAGPDIKAPTPQRIRAVEGMHPNQQSEQNLNHRPSKRKLKTPGATDELDMFMSTMGSLPSMSSMGGQKRGLRSVNINARTLAKGIIAPVPGQFSAPVDPLDTVYESNLNQRYPSGSASAPMSPFHKAAGYVRRREALM